MGRKTIGVDPAGTRNSSTMIVMMIAITPSLKASMRLRVILQLLRIRGSSPTVRKGVLLCGIALATEDARKYTPSLRVGLLPRSLSQRPQ